VGAFDTVRCKYPLPWPEVQDALWQTKDLKCYQHEYEIRENGSLWYHACDERWEEDPEALLGAILVMENHRWEPVKYDGEIYMYTTYNIDGKEFWYDVRLWLRNGIVKDVIHKKVEIIPIE